MPITIDFAVGGRPHVAKSLAPRKTAAGGWASPSVTTVCYWLLGLLAIGSAVAVFISVHHITQAIPVLGGVVIVVGVAAVIGGLLICWAGCARAMRQSARARAVTSTGQFAPSGVDIDAAAEQRQREIIDAATEQTGWNRTVAWQACALSVLFAVLVALSIVLLIDLDDPGPDVDLVVATIGFGVVALCLLCVAAQAFVDSAS